MADGPGRYRWLNRKGSDVVECSWLWSTSQLHTFQRWYYQDLDQNGWFTIELSTGRQPVPSGVWFDLHTREAHFVEEWTATLDIASGRWRVTATLEVKHAEVS